MVLERNKIVDLSKLAEKLKLWFIEKGWEMKVDPGKDFYVITAQKVNALRELFGACRRLVVACKHDGNKTQVTIKQGSWKENIASNLAWLIETGGANMGFTLWSYEVEREFKNYAQKVLFEL